MTPLYRVSEAVNDAEKYFPLHDYSALILRLWKTMRTYVSMLMHVHNSCSTTILTAFTRDFRSRRRNTLNLNKPCHC